MPALVAQLVEQQTFNLLVPGSSPGGGTMKTEEKVELDTLWLKGRGHIEGYPRHLNFADLMRYQYLAAKSRLESGYPLDWLERERIREAASMGQ